MGKYTGKPYRPSNGSEGECFIGKFCENCIHEKFIHTQNMDDKKCNILTHSMCFGTDDAEYPKEWMYDENDRPTCTNYKYWNWGFDDDDGPFDPPIVLPDDPNQLCLPFLLDEVHENINQMSMIPENLLK